MADEKKLPKDILYCSFCGRHKTDVKVLVAGPGVFICDECVDVCNVAICDKIAQLSQDEEA